MTVYSQNSDNTDKKDSSNIILVTIVTRTRVVTEGTEVQKDTLYIISNILIEETKKNCCIYLVQLYCFTQCAQLQTIPGDLFVPYQAIKLFHSHFHPSPAISRYIQSYPGTLAISSHAKRFKIISSHSCHFRPLLAIFSNFSHVH